MQVAEPPFAVASALAVLLFILTRLAVLALDHARHYDPLPTDPDIMDRWRQLQQCRVDGINRRIEALLQQAGLTPDWLNAA